MTIQKTGRLIRIVNVGGCHKKNLIPAATYLPVVDHFPAKR